MSVALVVVVAVFFAAMGLVALVAPERILVPFGIPSLTVDARNEVRAVYGGFGIAIAALLVAATRLPVYRPGILLCVAGSVFGMAAGRLISRTIEAGAGFYPGLFFGVEIALGCMLLLAL